MPLEGAGVDLNISLDYAKVPIPPFPPLDSSLGRVFAMAFQEPNALGWVM